MCATYEPHVNLSFMPRMCTSGLSTSTGLKQFQATTDSQPCPPQCTFDSALGRSDVSRSMNAYLDLIPSMSHVCFSIALHFSFQAPALRNASSHVPHATHVAFEPYSVHVSHMVAP